MKKYYITESLLLKTVILWRAVGIIFMYLGPAFFLNSTSTVYPQAGVPISTAPNPQEETTIASDEAGGAIITWQDLQSGIWDIYAERVDAFGMLQWFPPGIEDPGLITPESYLLQQNFPNPFNPTTTIRYDLPRTSQVLMSIYNISGERVRVLVNRIQTAGHKSIEWDRKDDIGQIVSSGLYLYKLKTEHGIQIRKMILVK